MSLHVLDTDTLSLYQRGHPVVVSNILTRPMAELAIAVISVEEQLTGWYSLLRQATRRDKIALAYERLADSIPFLAQFRILPFTERSIVRFESLVATPLPKKSLVHAPPFVGSTM